MEGAGQDRRDRRDRRDRQGSRRRGRGTANNKSQAQEAESDADDGARYGFCLPQEHLRPKSPPAFLRNMQACDAARELQGRTPRVPRRQELSLDLPSGFSDSQRAQRVLGPASRRGNAWCRQRAPISGGALAAVHGAPVACALEKQDPSGPLRASLPARSSDSAREATNG